MNQLAGILGILIVIALVLLVVRRSLSRGGLDERLQVYAAVQETGRRRGTPRSRSWLVRLRLRFNTAFSGLGSEKLALQLASANWPISPAEYSLTRYAGAGLVLVLGGLIAQNILVGIGLAILTLLLPGIFLRNAINRRQRAFERQLVDVLVLITGAVRSGFSLMQAMEVVMKELPPPVSEEFRRVLQEVGLGRPLTAALENMGRRMDNRDLDLLITAIKIQYTVGGNLTTMLEAVTETIRERIRLFGEIRALTAQQRFAAILISILPIAVLGGMFVIAPEYIRPLFNPRYIMLPVISGVLMIMGFTIIQRMAKMDV